MYVCILCSYCTVCVINCVQKEKSLYLLWNTKSSSSQKETNLESSVFVNIFMYAHLHVYVSVIMHVCVHICVRMYLGWYKKVSIMVFFFFSPPVALK